MSLIFNEQLLEMRVQSIEGAELFMGGSSKLLGDGEDPRDPRTTPIPEPTPLSLFALALFSIGLLRRK